MRRGHANMSGMTPRYRVLTYVTAATLILGSLVGCGLLSAAKKLANNAVLLGNLSEKITNAEKLTYQAVYKATDGTTDTIEQAPPKVAYLSSDSDWIFTGDTIYACDTESGALTCTKTVETSTDDPDASLAGLGAGGFFTGALGITLLAAALIVPQTNVKTSNKTIAGLSGTCVDVTGVDQNANDDDIVGFSLCVADNGIVTDFEGTYQSGKKDGITLQKYSTSVDSGAFAPPAGAKITDLNAPPTEPAVTNTGAPGDSASPSDSASPTDSASPAPSAS
jgi:hypothetical protein